MRFTQQAALLITVAITAVALTATTASASARRGTVHSVNTAVSVGHAHNGAAVSLSTCQVKNQKMSGQHYPDLQDAVHHAGKGDTLLVSGICVGTTSIGKDLTITGRGKSPTLDGGGSASDQVGSVLTITADVTLNRLTITGGSGDNGGGISSSGDATLTLNDSTVTGNTAEGTFGAGGGVYNTGDATLTLNDSIVTGNTAGASGGGILNTDGATLTLNDSTVTKNTAVDQGGGILNFGATLTLNDSAVSRNTAGNTATYAGDGGGIFNSGGGTLTLENGSTVTKNAVVSLGGGIFNLYGTLTLDDSIVSRNTAGTAAAGEGGGIWNDGALTLNDTTTSRNTVEHSAGPAGGGIFNDLQGMVTMNGGSTVSRNIVEGQPSEGGGIVTWGTVHGAECDVNVYKNKPDNMYPACP